MDIMKTMRRIAAAAVLTVLTLSPVFSAAPEGPRAEPDAVRVVADGRPYGGRCVLISDATYVSLREFAEFCGVCRVSWSRSDSTARVETDSLTLRATNGSPFIEANGRCIPCKYGVFIENGVTMAPLRALAAAFGYRIEWIGSRRTASLTRVRLATVRGEFCYDDGELFWLSRIISAEARGECFDGKLAVGTVIMNRVADPSYPDSIYGVIFDTKDGVQFTPAAIGTVYEVPDSDSVAAAKMILEGYRTSDEIMFFLNERLAESFWITNNCRYVMTVGNHDFYA
ncbi:MAG: cell wall hydrolase [Clostridia bacterium]|nr:cell wall hydrolase [Clostridia bacterium]